MFQVRGFLYIWHGTDKNSYISVKARENRNHSSILSYLADLDVMSSPHEMFVSYTLK